MAEDNENEVIIKPSTTRELKLIKALADGKEPREAAKIAGYSDSYIQCHLKKIVSKDKIQRTIERAMKAQGLDEGSLMKNLAQGLLAEKAIATKLGVIYEPDWSNRRHYLRMSLDLLGLYPDKTVKVETSNKTLEHLLREVSQRQEIDITPPIVDK
jgi:hypothetical protein